MDCPCSCARRQHRAHDGSPLCARLRSSISPTCARRDCLLRALEGNYRAHGSGFVRSMLVGSLMHYCCSIPAERTNTTTCARKHCRALDAGGAPFALPLLEARRALESHSVRQKAVSCARSKPTSRAPDDCRAHEGFLAHDSGQRAPDAVSERSTFATRRRPSARRVPPCARWSVVQKWFT